MRTVRIIERSTLALLLAWAVSACAPGRSRSPALAIPVATQVLPREPEPTRPIVRDQVPPSDHTLGTDAVTQRWLERRRLITNMLAPSGLRQLLEVLHSEDVSFDVGFTRADPSNDREHPQLAWRVSATEASASRETLEQVETRLTGMGFAAVGESEGDTVYRRISAEHRDDVSLSFTTVTDGRGVPYGTVSVTWYFALEHLKSPVTVGQLLKEAPYLRHPDVDGELYRFLEPLVVRAVENSATELREPPGWTYHKFWVFPPDDLDALLGRLTTLLESRDFYPPPLAKDIAMGKREDWSKAELYFARQPEEGLGLVMVGRSDDALMLALRIYFASSAPRNHR